MIKDFKEFALRGNVMDLAIGVVIGAAFGKIVTSLVNDIVMPPIGKLLGNVDFSNFFINLSAGHYETWADAKAAGAATVNYGIFLTNVVDFLIIAFSMFLVVRAMNRLRHGSPRPNIEPSGQEKLLMEIRDLLKK